jgi:hypothetical protein
VVAYGFQYDVGLEPVSVNLDRMIEKFRLGVKELIGIWKEFIPQDVADFLQEADRLPRKKFYIPDVIWVKTIYAFAIAAHKRLLNKEHLLKSLTPLYLGKVASFVLETQKSNASEVEEKIEKLCMSFENEKKYLLTNWN